MSETNRYLWGLAAVLIVAGCGAPSTSVEIDPDDIGGVVASAAGPEAGVWVIAETSDFDTLFARVVVTDDEGRYVVPDLPEAAYRLWVRGYGLVDSEKIDAKPGEHVDLEAVVARTRPRPRGSIPPPTGTR